MDFRKDILEDGRPVSKLERSVAKRVAKQYIYLTDETVIAEIKDLDVWLGLEGLGNSGGYYNYRRGWLMRADKYAKDLEKMSRDTLSKYQATQINDSGITSGRYSSKVENNCNGPSTIID